MQLRQRISRLQRFAIVVAVLFNANAQTVPAAAPKLPVAATVLDPDTFFYGWPYPAISPDGQWVAYVSKGFVSVCNIGKPVPRRVMEVPNSWTWTRFQVGSGDSTKNGTLDALSRGLERDERDKLHEQLDSTIYGLNWTFDSQGFVFGLQKRDRAKNASTYDGYLASTDGQIARLSHINPDSQIRGIVAGILTRDRKFMVSPVTAASSARYRPLICDVKENRPRATPFLFLTPSQTSGRWIGIEKDTQQLVVTDERFEVIKRYNETIPNKSYGLRIDWSPDERFIIWRNTIGFDHFSNWEGFRLDLDTGDKRKLEGRFFDEQFSFTGPSGEFYRCGNTGMATQGYDMIVGAHLTLIPDGNGPASDLWRIKVDPNNPKPRMLPRGPGNLPALMTPHGDLFALALPRPAGEPAGGVWHLINRNGKMWRFPGADHSEYLSPYNVVGFADNGKKLVAYDSTRLFTVPVSAIMVDENVVK